MGHEVSYDDAEEYGFGSLSGPGPSPSSYHLKWLGKTASAMADEYDDVFARLSATTGRVQESGHEIEAGWKEFLTGWLPPQYEVLTRKYIVGEIDSGEELEETDLVVLRPNYPSSLRGKSHVLASGVAAAFSVKSTLRKASIYEAAESCARLQRTLAPREGTPRKELTRPFPYGLLAHSHPWKSEDSSPHDNVSRHLFEADQKSASNPKDSLDFICVPDLGTWNHIKSVQLPFGLPPDMIEAAASDERQMLIEMASTLLLRSTFALNPVRERGDILASFLTSLYSRLALHDVELKTLADSFSLMGAESGGRAKCRKWKPEDVFSPALRDLPIGSWDMFTFGAEYATTYGWHVPL